VKRAILAVSVCLSISSSRAFAVDWSVNATQSETTELNDNQFLRSMLAGGTLGSYSTIAANAVASTPTSRLNLSGDFNYNKYWGPGTVGIPLTETTAGGMSAHYETFGKDATNRQYLDASWRTQSTSLAILSDLGIQTPITGNIDIATVRGGVERNLSALDFVALSARSSLSYFDPSGGGTPYLDTAGNVNWRHRLSAIASFSIASDAEWLSYDNATRTNIIILRNTAGFDVALSPLLNVHGNAGAAYIQASQGSAASPVAVAPQGSAASPVAVAPFSTAALTSGSGSAVGFIGDMSIIYRVLKSTTLSLTASQSVGPNTVGSLFQTDAISAGLTYSINQLSTLLLSGSFTRLTSSGVSDFISATIGYNRALTREWNANLSYRYLHRSATTGQTSTFDPITGFPLISGSAPARSNAIMLTVSHSVSVLPPGN
jgi:hypothetical protein